jgi:hypothetical protein
VCGTVAFALPGHTDLGNNDAFIVKYDADGDTVWTRQFGTSSIESGLGVAVHGSELYVVGYTLGAFPGETNLGVYDGFVASYDINGNAIWTRQYGTAEDDRALNVAVDPSGLYVCGFTEGAFSGSTQDPLGDIYVQKCDFDGNQLWVRQHGTTGTDRPRMALPCASGVYLSGWSDGDFMGGTNLGGTDALFLKYEDRLEPGETADVARYEILPAGNYTNTLTLDTGAEVTESDETNNVATDTYTVTEQPRPTNAVFGVPGCVAGQVIAGGSGVANVAIDAFAEGTGQLVAGFVTDNQGGYSGDLPPGDYMITVVTPLGYTAATEEFPITLQSGDTAYVDFGLAAVNLLPDRLALYPNVPNPFNPTTVIRYDVPAGEGAVSLRIYDVTGALIRTLVDGTVSPGHKSATWDGRDARGNQVSSGIYFYRLVAGNTTFTKKMVFLK